MNKYLAAKVVVEVSVIEEKWLRVGRGVGSVHGWLQGHARSVHHAWAVCHYWGVCHVRGGVCHLRRGKCCVGCGDGGGDAIWDIWAGIVISAIISYYCISMHKTVLPCKNVLSLGFPPHPRKNLSLTPLEIEYGARRDGHDQSG